MPGSVNAFDQALFGLINGGNLPFLDGFFVFLSRRYIALFAGAAVLLFLAIRHRETLRFVTAAVLAYFASDFIGGAVLKPLIGRVRPCYLLPPESVRLLIQISNSGAMPSLHASNSFAVAFVLTMAERRYALLWYGFAVLVGISRIWVGVHWPTDIIGGAVWGTLCGMAGWYLTAWLWKLRALRKRSI